MRVLIVGAGGREHALGWKIAQSPRLEKLFFAPGNLGTSLLGDNQELLQIHEIPAFCRDLLIDLVVVGPEAPLVDGLADVLAEAGIACFGPCAYAAQLEGSKSFSKLVMKTAGIPTADYRLFSDLNSALAFTKQQPHPLVIKVDGLAGGKGSAICTTAEESEAALRLAMVDRKFGDAGDKVIVEAYLQGNEASVHLICDGNSGLPLISAKDHKTLFEGDRGPNTGGMGTFAPNPLIDESLLHSIQCDICLPLLNHMRELGHPYRGVLYLGLMLTCNGPMVLEFNVRFGDPEAQVMLPMLDYDLLPVLYGAALGKLPQGSFPYRKGAAVCVVLASAGYPGSVRKGDAIKGLSSCQNAFIFHAGTRAKQNQVVTDGGRVLGMTAWASDLEGAHKQAYSMLDQVIFKGKHYRKDIGVAPESLLKA